MCTDRSRDFLPLSFTLEYLTTRKLIQYKYFHGSWHGPCIIPTSSSPKENKSTSQPLMKFRIWVSLSLLNEPVVFTCDVWSEFPVPVGAVQTFHKHAPSGETTKNEFPSQKVETDYALLNNVSKVSVRLWVRKLIEQTAQRVVEVILKWQSLD